MPSPHCIYLSFFCVFFFNDTATTAIYTLSLHDALPISGHTATLPESRAREPRRNIDHDPKRRRRNVARSEEHTSELQSPYDLVCRLLLEKKKKRNNMPRRHAKRRSAIIDQNDWRKWEHE